MIFAAAAVHYAGNILHAYGPQLSTVMAWPLSMTASLEPGLGPGHGEFSARAPTALGGRGSVLLIGAFIISNLFKPDISVGA